MISFYYLSKLGFDSPQINICTHTYKNKDSWCTVDYVLENQQQWEEIGIDLKVIPMTIYDESGGSLNTKPYPESYKSVKSNPEPRLMWVPLCRVPDKRVSDVKAISKDSIVVMS